VNEARGPSTSVTAMKEKHVEKRHSLYWERSGFFVQSILKFVFLYNY
jgi:hypothetical protein